MSNVEMFRYGVLAVSPPAGHPAPVVAWVIVAIAVIAVLGFFVRRYFRG